MACIQPNLSFWRGCGAASSLMAEVWQNLRDNFPGSAEVTSKFAARLFIFVVALCRSIALRAAWLFHHPARLPLAHPMRLPRMAHRTTPSFRA